MKLNQLTGEEAQIILHKGTEAPFSGQYEDFIDQGVFACRQCNAFLYRSIDKFDAHCGWPSFDDSILGAVTHTPDADGRRTEITCTRCAAHLGHIFLGENLTAKSTRHCVNSLSLRFIPREKVDNTSEYAYFGGGCFWCTEATFQQVKGVRHVTPGYAGGKTDHPTYESVCSGRTGHIEVIKIEFDPTIISYEGLLEVFFHTHNPTTPNQQGADIGTQYRSIILSDNSLQQEIAINHLSRIQPCFKHPIITEISPLTTFYPAEEYHHNYFQKNPASSYCQLVIAPKLAESTIKLRQYFSS